MAKVEIYTTTYCPYCHAAKRLLRSKNVPFEELDVTDDDARRSWLVEKTGRRTVPQIFIDGTPVGGFDDLSALDKAGRLDRILAGEEKAPGIAQG